MLAALSLLAACGSDGPTSVNGAISGSVAFTYTGGGGGSYNATGSIASSASDATARATTWSAGYTDATDNSTNIVSNLATSATLSNMAVIVINRRTVGSSTINTTCQPTTTTTCSFLALIIGQNASGSTFAFSCTLDAGTVAIASISATKVTGTFSGTGTCINGTTFASTTFVVTNGTFDVPLLTDVPGI